MNKRTISILFIVSVLILASMTVSAEYVPIKDKIWNQIEDEHKFNMTIRDYSGVRKLAIAGFYLRPYADMIGISLDDINSVWPNNKILSIFVSPMNGSQYFWPSDFSFVQDGSQYDINTFNDIYSLSGPFDGGEIKSGVVAFGLLALPEQIDTSREFTIWYDDVKTTL